MKTCSHCPSLIFVRLGAALLIACAPAWANTITCVHDSGEFRSALTAAETNADANLIELARGTYSTGGTQFEFISTTALQLDINGGYNSDCTSIIEDPRLTILDGAVTSSVLAISNHAGVSVRFLTLQNGSGVGLGVSSVGDLIIDFNIIRNNVSSTGSGGLYAGDNAASASMLRLAGNLIVGNSTGNKILYGAGSVFNVSGGNTYLINNTIADNVNTGTDGIGGLHVDGQIAGNAVLSNNIAWSNTHYGLDVADAPVLVDNDYGTLNGAIDASSSGNMSVAPKFVGDGSYRLAADSPLLAIGTLLPAGGLPTIDLAGNPRTFDNAVDFGAWERGDEIFKHGFDN